MKPVQHQKRAYHFAKHVQGDIVQEAAPQTIDIVSIDHRGRIINVVHLVVRKVNIIVPVCDALLGDKHSIRYRMATGVAVMAVGVSIAKVFGHVANPLLAYSADAIGFGIHAIGMVPFIDHLVERVRHKTGL